MSTGYQPMALVDQLQKEMMTAMKAKDEFRLNAIRMIKSALMKERVDSMKDLDEAAELKILNMLVKQRREAAEMFAKGGRADAAAKEQAELRIVESYMPAAASEAEMDEAIAAAIVETGATTAKEMGKAIAAARTRLTGKRVDGKVLSDRVKGKLS